MLNRHNEECWKLEDELNVQLSSKVKESSELLNKKIMLKLIECNKKLKKYLLTKIKYGSKNAHKRSAKLFLT